MSKAFPFALLLIVSSFSAKLLHARQPNVVVILTDDQGWGDLSVHGNTNLATPNIDALAREGVTADNFYVCQVCAPTRAEFLTGRYYPRTGVSGVSRGQERLNPDETTIADIFLKNGYATGCFGKWHNGTQPPYHPNFRGFEEFYGFTSGHWGHYFSPPLDRNGKRVRGSGYVVDDFTENAMAFIEQNRQQPFFCYLAINTPHSPMMVSDRFYEKFKSFDPQLRHRDPESEDKLMTRAALAMCENIDWNVGRLLKKLDELKLRENTIVVFFSDNGPNSFRWNGGMKGRKGSLDEGGLRSPFFLRWPGKVPAGKVLQPPLAAIDLLPTLTDLAGVKLKLVNRLDGQSFKHLLNSEPDFHWRNSRKLFSIKGKQVSIRMGRFRLDSKGRLFDVESDRGQRRPVSGKHPQLTESLRRLAAGHAREMEACFMRNAKRPFAVGFAPATTLPARDGIPHGNVKRSSKAPNNSFFVNWSHVDDSITWDVDIHHAGNYEAIVHYTCKKGNEGVSIRLSCGQASTEAPVTKVFDPPLYDKPLERHPKSHYFVKDFKPLSLGQIRLQKGKAILKLSASGIKGNGVIDVHSIDLLRQGKAER